MPIVALELFYMYGINGSQTVITNGLSFGPICNIMIVESGRSRSRVRVSSWSWPHSNCESLIVLIRQRPLYRSQGLAKYVTKDQIETTWRRLYLDTADIGIRAGAISTRKSRSFK